VKNIRFLSGILLLLIPTVLYSQNPYYDAVFLSEHAVVRNDSVFIKLDAMKRIADHLFNYLYLPESETGKLKNKEIPDTTVARILRNGFRSNPFFLVSRHVPLMKGKTPQVEKFTLNVLKPLTANVSGLNVSMLADGLGKFLVDRVKDELSLAFFDNFKKDLKRNADLQTVFPYTYDVLLTLDEEIYNFTAYYDMLREAFLKDFQLIIPNIQKLIRNPAYKAYFSQNPQLYSIIQVAFQIVEAYQNEIHPGNIITQLAALDTSIANPIDPQIKPSFQVLDLLIQSVRSRITDQYSVPLDSIRKNIINDSVTLKIYLGLIYQTSKHREIKFSYNGVQVNFSDLLDSVFMVTEKKVAAVRRYKNMLSEIFDRTEHVQQTLILSDKGEPTDKGNYKGYFAFYHASLNLLACIDFIPDSVTEQTTFKPAWGKNKNTCFYVANKLGEIYLNINELKYASAILNAAVIYDTIFSRRVRNYKVFNTGSLMIRYGNFAAIVCKADNSNEVKKALETVALPAGSSRLKRESSINIALNAYVGGFLGEEKFTYNQDNESHMQWRSTAGLTAPVGIGVSKGSDFPFGKKWRSSYSLFLSIIDLGAFTSFRFRDTINEIRPKIALENIFSPGLYFIYGVPKTPISVGGGWQYGPMLRKIESSAIDIKPKQYLKWCFFISVDIPFMNFYSRPKK
jgi:hypothetical protein